MNAIKNLALFRVAFYILLLMEWKDHWPHTPLDSKLGKIRGNRMTSGMDRIFAYDQFEFLQNGILPTLNGDGFLEKSGILKYLNFEDGNPEDACAVIKKTGFAVGGIALLGGLGSTTIFFLSSGLFTALFTMELFSMTVYFTNHHYLFLLLLIILTLSGGGQLFPKKSSINPQEQDLLLARSEWAVIVMRAQYAVLYLFASLWKISHSDWLNGLIVKGIMLSFESAGVARGVPWKKIYEAWPYIFHIVALQGLVLDGGMFYVLTFHRPSKKWKGVFNAMSILFHFFVFFTMSQRIGYKFPAACLAGSFFIFAPMRDEIDDSSSPPADDALIKERKHEDASVLTWTWRLLTNSPSIAYIPRWRRIFALLWILWQILMPLRMPYLSGGYYPWTGQCYRYSWTMMLHGKDRFITHIAKRKAQDGSLVEVPVGLNLFDLIPSCDGKAIIRKDYYPNSEQKYEDPRTMPLNMMLGLRQQALINVFLRHTVRVAGGLGQIIKETGGCPSVPKIQGAIFGQLNGRGAYSRLFDPTVDLVQSDTARKRRRDNFFWNSLKEIMYDNVPKKHEYILTKGIGSSSKELWSTDFKSYVQDKYPGRKIHLIADRKGCLAAEPLRLWPQGVPMAVVATSRDSKATFSLEGRVYSDSNHNRETQWSSLSEPQTFPLSDRVDQSMVVNSLEIGIESPPSDSKPYTACAETEREDILIAIVFLA